MCSILNHFRGDRCMTTKNFPCNTKCKQMLTVPCTISETDQNTGYITQRHYTMTKWAYFATTLITYFPFIQIIKPKYFKAKICCRWNLASLSNCTKPVTCNIRCTMHNVIKCTNLRSGNGIPHIFSIREEKYSGLYEACEYYFAMSIVLAIYPSHTCRILLTRRDRRISQNVASQKVLGLLILGDILYLFWCM